MFQTSTAYDLRQSIRSHIKPFAGGSPEKRTFLVGWSETPQTFEQIMDTLRPQIVNDLLYFKKMAGQYIGDLLQQGWLRLWKALTENAYFLEGFNKIKAGDFVSNRCGATTIRDYLKRYDSYHQISRWNDSDSGIYEESITEIVIGSSLKSSSRGRHAFFTRIVDRIIDIREGIRQVAEWCQDDIRKLVALYYLTTSVNQADAGQIAGMKVRISHGRRKCTPMGYWTKIVHKQLKEAFASYMPIEPNVNDWCEQIKKGQLDPVIELAEKYKEDSGKLLALYVLTTSVSHDTVVKECGVNDSVLRYATKKLRQELRWMYARRVPTSTL